MKLPSKRPGQAGGARDRNRRDNVERLRGAALSLFLAHGTEAVTIDQIVDRADMAKGSFYRYARDKADLVEQLMVPVTDDITAALDRCEHALGDASPATLASIYLRLATELADVLARHARPVLLYLQEVRAPAASERRAIHAFAASLTSRTVALTRIAHDHGLIRAVDPEVAALTVLGAVDALMFAHLRGRTSPGELPSVISELVAIVLRGVLG